MLYVFLALALLSGCALTYVASGFTSLAALWQVPVFFLGSFLALVVLFLLSMSSGYVCKSRRDSSCVVKSK